MGESLERVQNKFACIIGELCNEPVVLSKFAIWLDLRLAEYKAKGAISLDCSGESPDPKWLKGHEKPEPVVYKTDNHSYRLGNVGTHDIFNYGSNTSQPQGPPETKFGLNSNIIEDINERLSPEIVVVKEEVPDMPNSENIYPVGLHVHDQKTRKRPSTDIFPTSSPKSQRHMEDSSSISAQTGTQSLMSIIGENTDDIKDEHLSQSRGDNPMTFMPHTSIADQSYPQATISSPDESSSSQNYSSFHPQIDQTYSPNQSRQNAGSPTCPRYEVLNSQDSSQQEAYGNIASLGKKSVRDRIQNKSSKSRSTTNHISSAVSHLEFWLVTNYNEGRNIEEIPTKELNNYLCHFYNTANNPSGEADPKGELRNSVMRSASKCSLSTTGCQHEYFSWPYTMDLRWEEMPMAVRHYLERGIKLDRVMRLDFVRAVVDHINDVCKNPKKNQIDVIARRIYEKYPNSIAHKAVQVGEFTASSVPLPALSRQALLNSTEPGDDRDLVGVVSESAAQILQYLDLSSMWDYAEIGRRMCDTYPSIKRPGTHPWAVFVKKLSQKVRNIRWQLKKKDHKPNTKYYKRPSC